MRVATARILLAQASLSAVFFLLLAVSSGNAAAVNADGTWTSVTYGEGFIQDTWPADWHYEVKLQLGSTNSWWMKVVSVTNVQPGQESARGTIGNTFNYRVSYTSTSSGINLVMEGKTLALTVSGGKMYGSGTYNIDGTSIRWTVNLKGGSGMGSLGEMGAVAGVGAVVGLVGGVAGMAAAAAPAPKPIPRGIGQQPAGQQFWNVQRPQGPIYPNAPPRQPYTVAPGDERQYEPVPFIPPTPDPSQMQSLGGIGVHYGPPDTPPPPTPPKGEWDKGNPPSHTTGKPFHCGGKCAPAFVPGLGWRWQCLGCGERPWG